MTKKDMKVYIVVAMNDHCDYRGCGCIEKVFTNREKAERYLEECEREKIFSYIYYDIEECEVEQ